MHERRGLLARIGEETAKVLALIQSWCRVAEKNVRGDCFGFYVSRDFFFTYKRFSLRTL